MTSHSFSPSMKKGSDDVSVFSDRMACRDGESIKALGKRGKENAVVGWRDVAAAAAIVVVAVRHFISDVVMMSLMAHCRLAERFHVEVIEIEAQR